ncbi:MAG: SDR family NAD(P)-dependent oxidoreductase [Acidimicrobiia bacterium]
MSLDGKVAIVTGAGAGPAGGGSGAAIAEELAARGAQVVVVDVDAESAARTTGRIAAAGRGGARPVVVDLGEQDACERVVAEAVEAFGRIDAVVNNLAVTSPGTVVDTSEAQWARTIELNLATPVRMCRHAIPWMVRGGGGSVVNIGSSLGLRGLGASFAYAVSKAGLLGLTREVAVAHGPDGIRCNLVVPGHMHTPMAARVAGGERIREVRRRLSPLGIEGTGADVAQAVAFLVGDESRWITGVVLPVDGGMLATIPLRAVHELDLASGS